MRIKHWLKNGLIFLPLLCSSNFFEVSTLSKTIVAFFSFSFAASAVYIINDLRDADKDSLHNIKKHRPIASGRIKPFKAKILVFLMCICSLILHFIAAGFELSSLTYLLLYLSLNCGYSFGLKNYAIVDVVILAIGFVLRMLYGGAICDIELSKWIYLVVICFSFFLALGKRRNELIQNGVETRKSLQYYSYEFLDRNMYMYLGLTIVFYSLWTMDNHELNTLFWTIPILLLICMRYSMDVENSQSPGDPVEVILADQILIVLVCLFIILFFISIYGKTICMIIL